VKYKQKLMLVEAFQYLGDFDKLSAWYREHSTHSTLPFYHSGRELYIFVEGEGTVLTPNSYVILAANRKDVTIQEREEFEASHVVYRPGDKK